MTGRDREFNLYVVPVLLAVVIIAAASLGWVVEKVWAPVDLAPHSWWVNAIGLTALGIVLIACGIFALCVTLLTVWYLIGFVRFWYRVIVGP